MKKIISAALLVIAGAIAFTACLKKNFNNPPDTSHNDPHLTVTHTIAQLKAMNGAYSFATGGDTTTITGDVIISGIVTADDRAGNIYKSIYIEDSTGAIQIAINQYNLYNDYPAGRKIYVKCKGLLLGYNGGAPMLGYTTDETNSIGGIYGTAVDAHIIKADVGHAVTPLRVTPAQLDAIAFNNPASLALLNRFVVLDSVQFMDTTLTYTQPNGASVNRFVGDCVKTIEVYTSNYAVFAQQMVPKGRGSMAAVFTIYTSTVNGRISPELIIRDVTDLNLTGTRCTGGSGGGGGSAVPVITIDSLRRLYPGTGSYIVATPAKIAGVVISDVDNKNVTAGNFVIEDGSRKGIIMYIANSTAYKIGDSVVVDITGATLKKYPVTGVGVLEIDGLSTSKVMLAGTGRIMMPVAVTIAQLNASISLYENVLVKIVRATAGGGSTYGSSVTLSDTTAANGLSLYTAGAALFAGQAVPAGAKTFVGIALPYATRNEVKLRNPATDVY